LFVCSLVRLFSCSFVLGSSTSKENSMPVRSREIAEALIGAGAVLLRPQEPFTFASGLRSPVYCDNRLLLGNVAARRVVMAGFVERCAGADVLAGPATGGIPWAAWAADALSLPMAYVRGSAKGHGRGQQIEGAAVTGRRVIVLEDTVSTGESALNAIEALAAQGAAVARCVCIFTWGWAETAARFVALGAPLEPLATLVDVLDAATIAGKVSAEQRRIVEAWAVDPQGWKG
jgi:orotate phosphoribosyltransferase